jgi:hypothetical protein
LKIHQVISKSGPIQSEHIVPNEQLVHVLSYQKRISKTEIERLAVEKYKRCGKGVSFNDIINHFGCSKTKAQRILKHCCSKRVHNAGRPAPILFRLSKRTKPQQYFPSTIRADILEKLRNRENVLIEPTGLNLSSYSNNPISNALDYQKAQHFLDVLKQIKFSPLYIHKLQLQLSVNPEVYHDVKHEFNKYNRGKIHLERIGSYNVKYLIYPNGRVLVYIACSDTPFKLETDNDVSFLFAFLGQVRDRLLYMLSDVRERFVPSIMDWRLLECDVNKDIVIDDMAQLTLPDILLKDAGRVFRLYVKSLQDKPVYRCEESLTIDLPISLALDEIRFPYKSTLDSIKQAVDEMNQKLDNPSRSNGSKCSIDINREK